MTITVHLIRGKKIGELVSDACIIASVQDGTDLLGQVYYDGFDGVIIREQNIAPAFFDLSSGMAGEILQKFSNYKISLALVGNFGQYSSRSLAGFIRESNKQRQVIFAADVNEALDMLG